MSDLNICTFTGRLGRDPEVKSFQSGGRICNLAMAVGQQWKDKNSGERKERVEWVQVTIQNDGLVGVAERFLRKGSRIAISGEFRTRKWQDRDGHDRWSTEIVLSPFNGSLTMLDSAKDGQGGTDRDDRRDDRGGGGSNNAGRNSQRDSGGDSWGGGNGGGGWADDLDDDIPFVTNASIW